VAGAHRAGDGRRCRDQRDHAPDGQERFMTQGLDGLLDLSP
jgi:hypothetical protein